MSKIHIQTKLNSQAQQKAPEKFRDFFIAAKILWISLNLSFLILIALIYLSENIVLKISLWLKGNHTDFDACVFCGMTRAFIKIARGHWQDAYLINAYSFVAFSFIFINFIVIFLFIKKNLKQGKLL